MFLLKNKNKTCFANFVILLYLSRSSTVVQKKEKNGLIIKINILVKVDNILITFVYA